jgi:two-component system cell cycle response regulator DivK
MEGSRSLSGRQQAAAHAEAFADLANARHVPPPNLSKPPKRRVLIVEPDLASLRLCRDVLERSDFAVETASSGIAALISARDNKPDLILMDLQLPDVPGREAIVWLRSNPALRSIPIIVLTTASADDADLAATRPSVSLRKPISAAAIQRAVREVLN